MYACDVLLCMCNVVRVRLCELLRIKRKKVKEGSGRYRGRDSDRDSEMAQYKSSLSTALFTSRTSYFTSSHTHSHSHTQVQQCTLCDSSAGHP